MDFQAGAFFQKRCLTNLVIMAAQSFSFNLAQARRVTINIRSVPYPAAPAIQGGAALEAAADLVVGEVADEVAPPGTATESTPASSDSPLAPFRPPRQTKKKRHVIQRKKEKRRNQKKMIHR